MCDQDHFEEDRLEYEKRGLVTRRQFGALMGVGMAMMLPKVVNAVDVKEQDVTTRRARLALVSAFGVALKNTLDVLGIVALERM